MKAPISSHLRSPLRAACVVGILLGGLWLWGNRGGNHYSYRGTPLEAKPAPALSLVDDRGAPFRLDQLHGQAVLVYFGYTHCPEVCSTTLLALGRVFHRLGDAGKNVKVIFVTLDPSRDNPAVLHDYLANFYPTPIGLTGSSAEIAQAAKAWNISWTMSDMNGMMDHSSVLTLIGPDGIRRALYGSTQLAQPDDMVRDIRHVIGAS